MSDPYLGQIMTAAFGFAPVGYALCDGSVMPIQQNQALYSLLGQIYGGNGQNNFKLPDLRGRAMLGAGNSKSGTVYPLGQYGGAESVALTLAQVPPHTHNLNANSGPGTGSPVNNLYSSAGPSGGQPTTKLYAPPGAPATLVNLANQTSSAGGGLPHDNMQPFLVLNMAIAIRGTYPPRP